MWHITRFRPEATTLGGSHLVLYTQGYINYNMYIAETNKYQSHRGHIVY